MDILSKVKALLNIESYKTLYGYSKGYRLKILKITVINIIISVLGVLTAALTKEIIDSAISSSLDRTFKYGLAFILIITLQIVLSSYISYLLVIIKSTLRNELQLNYLKNIYGKNWLLITRYNTGDLSTRLYDDIIKVVNSITSSIPSIIALSLQLVLGFIYLAYYDMLLAIITITATPVFILMSMIIGTKLKKVQKKIQDTESEQWSKTNESISNLTIIKTFNYTDQSLKDVHNIQLKKFNYEKRRTITKIKANIFLDIGYFIGFIASITIGAYRLSYGVITFGTMTALIQLIGRIQVPLEDMSTDIPALISSFSSVERLQSIYNISEEVHSHINIDHNVIPTQIDFSKVHFSYTQDKIVLENIDFIIEAGDKIAILGASGEGKTTLINILLSLITPDRGSVTIKFSNDKTYPLTADFRNLFSYVSQTNMLFTGTIRDNFLLTKPTTHAEIQKALAVSCCNDFIAQLDEGIDTMLLEDGLGLSQGQLQRLSIARALLHDRPFLIFDEATSSLDEETERILLRNIKDHYNNITLIAITHRKELLSICNKVVRISHHGLTIENKEAASN